MKPKRLYTLILRPGTWNEEDIHRVDIHTVWDAAMDHMADGEAAVLYSHATGLAYSVIRKGHHLKPYTEKPLGKAKGVQPKSVSKKRDS